MLAAGIAIVALLAADGVGAAPPRPVVPGAATASANEVTPGQLKLKRTAGGGFRHQDRAAGFEATIHADGTVSFRDIPRLGLNIDHDIEDDGTVSALFRGPYAPQQDAIEETGNPRVYDGGYGPAPIIIGVGGNLPGAFDTGRKGPKAAFLRDTAGLRAKLAASAERKRIAVALVRLGGELLALWRDHRRPIAERRAIIFARWDELQESPPDPPPPEPLTLGAAGVHLGVPAPASVASRPFRQDRKQTAGELARRRIEAFIRKVAPRGSAQAFTPAELRRFNAGRRSHQRFDPYGAQASD